MRIQPGRTPNRKSGVTPGGFPLLRRVGDAAAPLIDVIFVHGLGGDTRSTWQAASSLDCMLDWIAEDCPAAQVWSLDYPAVTTRWTDRGRGMALPRRARGLIELLLQLGIGERGLVFVCHSLGGLVVKQILRHSRELSAPGWEDIANSVLGVVFIATPHGGSSLASFAKAAIVTRPSASTRSPSRWATKAGLAEAEAEFRQVLAARVRELGRDHPDTLLTRHCIATALGKQGQHAAAEAESRQVLDARLRVQGPDHPETLNTRFNIAVSLMLQRKPAEAEAEFRRVLDAQLRVLGPDHPDILNTRRWLQSLIREPGGTA